jgi:hypothetical protein
MYGMVIILKGLEVVDSNGFMDPLNVISPSLSKNTFGT